LFLQVGAKIKDCVPCQMFAGKQKLAALPLVPSIVLEPFSQWGLNFIGEIQVISIDESSLQQNTSLNGWKQFQ